MRRYTFSLILALALAAVSAATAESPPEGAQIAVDAAAAHDHGATCGAGGECCAACQFREKYAAQKPAEAEAGCPCKRARAAREQAQQAVRDQAHEQAAAD